MNSTHLTPRQLAALQRPVIRQLRHLARLRARMDKTGFPPTDPLYQKVTAAHAATHALRLELHYLSVNAARDRRDAPGGNLPQP